MNWLWNRQIVWSWAIFWVYSQSLRVSHSERTARRGSVVGQEVLCGTGLHGAGAGGESAGAGWWDGVLLPTLCGRGVSEGIGDVLSREKMLTSVILFQTLWSWDIQWFYEADGGPPNGWKEVAVRRVAVAFLRWDVRVWGNSLMLHWGFFITGVWNNFLKEGCSSIEMGCSEKCWVPIPEGI